MILSSRLPSPNQRLGVAGGSGLTGFPGGNCGFPPALSLMRSRDKRLLALLATVLAVMFICKLYSAV
jgi:hypothetical protein